MANYSTRRSRCYDAPALHNPNMMATLRQKQFIVHSNVHSNVHNRHRKEILFSTNWPPSTCSKTKIPSPRPHSPHLHKSYTLRKTSGQKISIFSNNLILKLLQMHCKNVFAFIVCIPPRASFSERHFMTIAIHESNPTIACPVSPPISKCTSIGTYRSYLW